MPSQTQDVEYNQSRRVLYQILLHRYQQLLKHLETIYTVSPEQRERLIKTILTHEWITEAD